VGREVDPSVRNAALHKLFSDPVFNVMDGLDIYIDDYGKPDPLPRSMLRQMVQSRSLGLFDDEDRDKLDAEPDNTTSTTGPRASGPDTASCVADSAPAPDSSNSDDSAAEAPEPESTRVPTQVPTLTPGPVDAATDLSTAKHTSTGPAGEPLETSFHEDPHLRLQPHHADGPAREPGHGGTGTQAHTGGQR
jgi:hypothetical protein